MRRIVTGIVLTMFSGALASGQEPRRSRSASTLGTARASVTLDRY